MCSIGTQESPSLINGKMGIVQDPWVLNAIPIRARCGVVGAVVVA